MQITGWILTWMQIGPGKAGRDALPSHSHLESAAYRLLTSAARSHLLGLGGRLGKPWCVVKGSEGLQILYGSMPWAQLVAGES